MRPSWEHMLHDNPVIASVKDEAGTVASIASECRVVFLLYGSLLTVDDIVARLVSAGKTVFIDIDLLEGFAAKEIVVTYLRDRLDIAGILSSKAHLVRAAKRAGLIAIHRAFLIDSFSYHSLPGQLRQSEADCVEILPGCMPRVITWLRADITLPIIAGGLVCDKEDVLAALDAGASAIATSNHDVWSM